MLEYLDMSYFGLLYDWACQKPFVEIMAKTTKQEGDIVRSVQNVKQSLTYIKSAARIIGDPQLAERME